VDCTVKEATIKPTLCMGRKATAKKEDHVGVPQQSFINEKGNIPKISLIKIALSSN